MPSDSSPKPSFEVIDPVWLVKALALSFSAALLCAWLTMCLLFYQGEWQLILHPIPTIDQTPAAADIPFESIRFDAGEAGQPRLTGWWIPATSGKSSLQSDTKYAAYTILYLHDGSLSLSATVPALTRLHEAGLNVFAIDYRGFGLSEATAHPTEARMTQDVVAALAYLTSSRQIPASLIVPYGTGLGASLAANLARSRPELPAVILDNPDPDPTSTAVAAHPSHLVPVRLLFRERFDIASPVAALKTPKLLIAGGPNTNGSHSNLLALQIFFRRASSPSLSVVLPTSGSESAYQTVLVRFVDQYLKVSPNQPR